MNIAVIGGGISGLRAALTLARAGCAVTLFEKNGHLGGRVFSFPTPDFGEVDIGQHIWLRACTAFEELLSDLAVPDDWVYRQDRVSMPYRMPDGSCFLLAPARLPAALAMLPAVLRLPGPSFLDKLRFLGAALRVKLLSERAFEALDSLSFADWLRARRQSPAVIAWFWEPFVKGVCNGRLEEVSARHALLMVRMSLLDSPEASAICLLRPPLSAVFDRHARCVLQQAGVSVRTSESIAVVRPGQPVVVRTGRGEECSFERVVLALPLKNAKILLEGVDFPQPPEEGAIVGLLVRFARPVMNEMFFTAVGGPVQHVFNKTAIRGEVPPDGSQIIELVLSAAEREARLGVEGVAAELLPALTRLLPGAAQTPILARRLLVHATATFRVTPGAEAHRPPLRRADVPGIVFAGDHAATGLPSTMESAAVAGRNAARALLVERAAQDILATMTRRPSVPA
jgi:squalene-associated FAD-dependent desaturase